MHLIVSEKYNAAQRISAILSKGNASRTGVNDVPVFTWAGGNTKCIGLAGHVVELDFPEEYNEWNKVQPEELIDAPLEVQPVKHDIVKAVQSLANQASKVTIATDYDREGELIGKEAIDLIEHENESATIRRAEFSSLTAGDVKQAFENPTTMDYDLAAAGETRQRIDLRWGASLTRFFTLASPSRDGVMSVGRVQTPTLKLVVDREREILHFDPDPYWEITAAIRSPESSSSVEAQYYYHGSDENEAVRVWDESKARAIHSTIHNSVSGEVVGMREKQRNDYPPTPFDTTEFIQAAGAIGFDAKPAMSIAETLYDDGHITYPRTDNTVYPDELSPEKLLKELASNVSGVGQDIEHVLSQDSLSPTTGDAETTDHPPIHPTKNTPAKNELNDSEWEIYELVVRRFAATYARPAVWNHRRIDVQVDEHLLKANGKTIIKPGYHAVYPYFNTSENELPMLNQGGIVQLGEAELAEKETQPPNRYNQSNLIGTMKDSGLGTKSTRHNTIDKLYNRNYIKKSPPEPTERAYALINATEKYASQMTTAETTAELEEDMNHITTGEKSLSSVEKKSCEMLREVFGYMTESRENIVEALNSPTHGSNGKNPSEEDAIGPCPECGKLLLPKQGSNESKFIGCNGYPDCEFTLSIPDKGRVHLLDETCDNHGFNHIKMIAGSETDTYGCPQCQQEKADNIDDREIGKCPECGDTHDGIIAIKNVRTGSRLIGCERYPDCDYSLPVPQSGNLVITDSICEKHSLPKLQIRQEDESTPWELGCPICNYQSMSQ